MGNLDYFVIGTFLALHAMGATKTKIIDKNKTDNDRSSWSSSFSQLAHLSMLSSKAFSSSKKDTCRGLTGSRVKWSP